MLNSKVFNFQFFLGGKKTVKSLSEGAYIYGGATKYEDKIISNFETDEYIMMKNDNEISIFIPSTRNVDQVIDNAYYVKTVIKKLKEKYNLNEMKFFNTYGSWYDSISNKVVEEKITIITMRLNKLSNEDLLYFIEIANYLKVEMLQQGISLAINDSLAII